MSELHPKVVEALQTTTTGYEIIPCDPKLADTEAFCAEYGFSPQDSANTILVIGKSDPAVYVACVVLATTKLDVNKAVSKRLGIKRCSFASAEQTIEQTDMMIGGVTAIGLSTSLPIWIDAAVMERDAVILGGGSRSAKLYCSPKLLLELPNAEVVEGLALPRS